MTAERTPTYRILVPLDGSSLAESALAYAAALALPGDEVRLLHVASPGEPPRDRRGDVLPMTEQDLEKHEETAKQVTAGAAALWGRLLPNVTHRLVCGDPAGKIVAAARDRVDLIVMASHGRGALGRWCFGSVADAVVRHAPVPTMVIRPFDADEGFAPAPVYRFVVPLDGSELARQALPVVERLARRMHRPVRLLHVGVPAPVPVGRFGAAMAESAARDAVATLERDAWHDLSEAATQLDAAGIGVAYEIDAGDPAERIGAHVTHGEVLVLASHGRSGLDRFVLGSVADKLIRQGDAPVIVVHPGMQPGA